MDQQEYNFTVHYIFSYILNGIEGAEKNTSLYCPLNRQIHKRDIFGKVIIFFLWADDFFTLTIFRLLWYL
jgi:hypothetical protein